MRAFRRRKFRLRRYHSDSRVLAIALTTELHEQLHLALYHEYYNQLVRAGLEMTWKSKGVIINHLDR